MTESRRDRKKRETRRWIADAAIGLFLEQGYDRTTVAQIAAAADVDPKTFFNYFGSKDEVLFERPDQDVEVLLETLPGRRLGEHPGELLARIVDHYDTRLLPYRSLPRDPAERARISQLILDTPALQAKLAALLQGLQQQLAQALLRACRGELDEITAAAMTGSLLGAMYQAALVSIRRGHSPDEGWQVILRARDIAAHGLLSVELRSVDQRTEGK